MQIQFATKVVAHLALPMQHYALHNRFCNSDRWILFDVIEILHETLCRWFDFVIEYCTVSAHQIHSLFNGSLNGFEQELKCSPLERRNGQNFQLSEHENEQNGIVTDNFIVIFSKLNDNNSSYLTHIFVCRSRCGTMENGFGYYQNIEILSFFCKRLSKRRWSSDMYCIHNNRPR